MTLQKKEIEEIMKIPGDVRGTAFQTDAFYIKAKEGEKGLKKVEAEMKKFGCPIKYSEITAMEWLPVNKRVLSFLVMKDVLGWSDEDIREMGINAPKCSFIVKLLMKFFVSVKEGFARAPTYWKKHYNVGLLEMQELDEQEKHGTVILRDFKTHPVYCKYLEGYFQMLGGYILGKENVKTTEQKCIFKGDEYHLFRFEW